MKIIWLTVSVLVLCFAGAAPGKALYPDEVPDPLQPWVEWALYGKKDRDCFFLYNRAKRHCAWPSSLELNLGQLRGLFEQTWTVDATSWVALPGNDRHWPEDVAVNDQPAVVADRNGKPAIKLEPGIYTVTGRFSWPRLPETLFVPATIGLISLIINEKPIAFPDIDQQGQLWLRQREVGAKTRLAEDRLDIQVFRRIVDEIPLSVVTRIELDVAGAQREVLLGKALLKDFVPLRLTTQLPARLEADGHIRLQVRPGRWYVELEAHSTLNRTQLTLSPTPRPWPDTEVWVFDARNNLRLVEVEGVTGVDPRQTKVPTHWRNLPTYQLIPGDTMTMKVVRRGDPEPEPNTLLLNRNLWLDFDGDGYTVQDAITGSMTSGWRLETNPSIALGRVVIDGQGLFITRAAGSDKQGVEVRRGTINLIADSRYEGLRNRLPAVGWDHDFRSINTTLHLPPGWKLFSAVGPDNVPNTWLQRWTLLDLFLVLIVSLATYRLWGWHWGVLALLTLSLIWHEPNAPRFVFLNILAAIALLRVLPKNRFERSVRWYKYLSLATLLVIAIPFMVDEVRIGLYPQLERPWQGMRPVQPSLPITALTPRKLEEVKREAARAPAADMAQEERLMRNDKGVLVSSSLYEQVDPNAFVQTGPGVPSWSWTSVPLRWNGPVERHQEVELLLLSPKVNLALNLLRVALLNIFILLMFDLYDRWRKRPLETSTNAPPSVTVAMFALLVGGADQFALPASAEASAFPGPALLEELQDRLLAPPDCLPSCAQSPRLHLNITPDVLTMRMAIHASEDTALPLPLDVRQWVPAAVLVDGDGAERVFRTGKGQLWIGVDKGTHQVVLSGPLPSRNRVQFPLILKSRSVTYEADGWAVAGVHDDGGVADQLQLTRLQTDDDQHQQAALEPTALPPFVRIERVLRLGLDWRVETLVTRISPRGSAIVIEVPLLESEAVTTPGVKVSDGRVLVNMGAEQTRLVWHGILKKQDIIVLKATNKSSWTEIWKLDVSPIWHAEPKGIPVIHHQDTNSRWLPQWRPWPGDEVRVALSRAEGVGGKTLTIDRVQLDVSPGKRATDMTLQTVIRSSQGGQHTLTLPEQAHLQSVTIDERAQPIRQEGRTVTLPIHPGSQSVTLRWREATGIQTSFATPKVDVGAESVNTTLNVSLGRDRWVLLVGGPRLGPAVLFWGVLIIIVLVAFGLGYTTLTPLKTWHWLLLGIGLSQVAIEMALVVVGWLFALAMRERLDVRKYGRWFNGVQIMLAMLTVFSVAILFIAVERGLLGAPDMQIAGNQSTATALKWYADRSGPNLPEAWAISVPLLVYRVLMLLWSLWLSLSLLRWLKWGWACYSNNALWIPRQKKPKTARWRKGKSATKSAEENSSDDDVVSHEDDP